MKISILILLLPLSFLSAQSNQLHIYGKVLNYETNRSLADVNVSVLTKSWGTTTDSLGNFSLTIPFGTYKIKFSFVGFEDDIRNIILPKGQNEIKLAIKLVPKILEQSEVNVHAKKENLSPVIQEIKEKDLDKMPNMYSDVIRSVKILPGVTSNNELTSAYNVRGGNFSENLIYLNGYEIFRPFLIDQGVEESQSIINQNMVGNLQFYNGSFPARYDDKMSSALEVNYKNNNKEYLNGEINFNLLNMGLTLQDKMGKFNWMAGFRDAYPTLFLTKLQTAGKYKPKFMDFQFFGTYNFSENSSLQLLFLNASNKFDLTPENWKGHFQASYLDVKEILFEYSGSKIYNFSTNLAGLRFLQNISKKTNLVSSISYYTIDESENKNLYADIYYAESAYNTQLYKQLLKTRYEKGNNSLKINIFDIQSSVDYKESIHNIEAGIKFRLSKMDNSLNESAVESAVEDSVLDLPYSSVARQNLNFNSFSTYVQDEIIFNEKFHANVGLRFLKYYYNKEALFSPRASVSYNYTPANKLSFSWGYYYQPPFFYELRDKNTSSQPPLLSQRAIHYILSWEIMPRVTKKFLVEAYYKKLDMLIPYHIENLKLIYGDKNNYKGYAYGLDLQYEGELVPGMNTWIGYSYLNTKEKNLDDHSTGYVRRLLDQTHTIRVFLQDRTPKHPNFQAHVLFLVGSGFLYYPRKVVTDPATNKNSIAVDYTKTFEYPFFFRVDMGLTNKFIFSNESELILTFDVYNIFNKYNYESYSWFNLYSNSKQLVYTPNIFSKRFFNAGLEYHF